MTLALAMAMTLALALAMAMALALAMALAMAMAMALAMAMAMAQEKDSITMTQRSEHGGGEAAIQRESMEAYAYNNEKRDRKLGKTAVKPYVAPPFGDLPYSRDMYSPSNQQREYSREETDSSTTQEES